MSSRFIPSTTHGGGPSGCRGPGDFDLGLALAFDLVAVGAVTVCEEEADGVSRGEV